MGLLPLLEVTWEVGNDRKQEGDWPPVLVTQGAGRSHLRAKDPKLHFQHASSKQKKMNFKMLSLSVGISALGQAEKKTTGQV